MLKKIGKQMTKDYVVHPLLSGPSFLPTLAANFTANVVRNLWTHSVIMCGHFPEGVETFEKTSIDGETRGEWYLRQMLGSANISGSKAMHLMTGNLSHQVEHHLFPDLPSNRYAEIAPQVKDLFDRYGLRYHSASLPRQVGSAWHKVHPAVAAQRLAGRDHPGQRPGPGGQALPDDDRRPQGPPRTAERRLRRRLSAPLQGPAASLRAVGAGGSFVSGAWRTRPGRTGAAPARADRGRAARRPAPDRSRRPAPGPGPARAVTSTAP